MPLSSNFTARVPLVSGKIDRKNSGEYAELLRVIYDDFFEKNLLSSYTQWKIKMFNRNYSYQIDFGNITDMEQKFKDYKAFFKSSFRQFVI
jgi:cell division protein FtsQ